MDNNKYSFTPLHGAAALAEKYYGVRRELTNFLIDEDGKIILKKFVINHLNHRTLELIVAALL